jgi:hypothetical protein
MMRLPPKHPGACLPHLDSSGCGRRDPGIHISIYHHLYIIDYNLYDYNLYDYNHAGGGSFRQMIDNTCLRVHALPHRPPGLGPYSHGPRLQGPGSAHVSALSIICHAYAMLIYVDQLSFVAKHNKQFHSLPFTIYSLLFALYPLSFTLYSLFFILYSVLFTLSSLLFILYPLSFTLY